MNTWKLAFTNIKKSVSDYVVYFITLILGVAIFYVFNAIGDQALVEDLSNSGYEMIKLMISLLAGASVGVALVLGFLIVYANHFLIRRRKKEFGIYLLLGMGKKQVSAILFCETLIAGLISLGIGLGIGILGSQYLSIFVGKFLDADMSAYRFSLSVGALLKTIFSFVIMNLVVLIFHAAAITKYQLVDLLAAGKKAEVNVVGTPVRSVVLFLISAAVLGYAYVRVGFYPQEIRRGEMVGLILAGAVANMVLFWSMAGFLMTILQKCDGIYFRKLNAFVSRQFCAGINSSAVTMGIICLMLFVTILMFSTGFSLANEFQKAVRSQTPVDFSVQRDDGVKVSDWMADVGRPMEEWAKEGYAEIPIYGCAELTFADTMGSSIQAMREQFSAAIFWDYQAEFISEADYNRLMRIYGKDEVSIREGTYLMVCNFRIMREARSRAMAEGLKIPLGGTVLVPADTECLDSFLMMSGANMELGTVILPESLVQKAVSEGELQPVKYLAAGDFKASGKSGKREMENWLNDQAFHGSLAEYAEHIADQHVAIGTKISIREANNGLTMMVTFLVIYVGSAFLIASAAILSLKALSESIDSQGRYEILKKMGCDRKMLRRALFMQIGVFFLLPIFIAAVHSLFGLRFMEAELQTFLAVGTGYGTLVTLLVMIVLYGGYMLASIRASERIVGVE